jgi:DNA-binding Lrp family transcriptional regulator
MVTAYVMVKANTGDADRLRESIADLEGVDSVHIVAGDVDLIARLDVASTEAVKDVVAGGVQSIEGVESTETYLAMD